MRTINPIEIVDLSSTPAGSSLAGFYRMYTKGGWFQIQDSVSAVKDAVLDRPLEGFTCSTVASSIAAADTVLEAFQKVCGTLNNLALTGDITGTASYNSSTGKLEIATVAGSGLTIGSQGEIPFSNAAGTDFNYTSNLLFDGTSLFISNAGTFTNYALHLKDGFETTGGGKFLKDTGDGKAQWSTITKTDVGLSNVENTALSTWAGSTNIITLGTITTGTWNGTAIIGTYIDESTVDHDQLLNFSANEHFTESSIDHTAIQNIGTNTHAQIDTHIADATIHFTQASIDHTSIQNIGTNTHAQIDTHIADTTVHFTQASITTVGTVSTGVWQGTAIADTYVASATTWNAKPGKATGLLNSFTSAGGGLYYMDFAHNLGTEDIVTEVFHNNSNETTLVESINRQSTDIVRVTVVGNSTTYRITVIG